MPPFDVSGIGDAIVGLVDKVVKPIAERLPTPLNFIVGGIAGLIKGVIETLIG